MGEELEWMDLVVKVFRFAVHFSKINAGLLT